MAILTTVASDSARASQLLTSHNASLACSKPVFEHTLDTHTHTHAVLELSNTKY